MPNGRDDLGPDQVMRWIVQLVYWSLFLWALAEDAAEFPEEDGVLVLTEHFGIGMVLVCTRDMM